MVSIFKNLNIKYLGILTLLTILFLTSCSPEYKLARQYIKHHKGDRVIIVPLYELGKDNLSISYDTSANYNPEQFDSIAWVQSAYIQNISDSLFLTKFTRSLINGLVKQGYDVYVGDSSDVLLTVPDPRWVVWIAQLQLDEYHTITTYEVHSEKVGGKQFEDANLRMNMVSLNSWFEASRSDTGKMQILHLEEFIMDNRTLGFDFALNKGNEGLQKNRDSLKMNDIYKMADESGQNHAKLLFEHFMNNYICINMPLGMLCKEYYFYDIENHSLNRGINQWYDADYYKSE